VYIAFKKRTIELPKCESLNLPNFITLVEKRWSHSYCSFCGHGPEISEMECIKADVNIYNYTVYKVSKGHSTNETHQK